MYTHHGSLVHETKLLFSSVNGIYQYQNDLNITIIPSVNSKSNSALLPGLFLICLDQTKKIFDENLIVCRIISSFNMFLDLVMNILILF
jgi:hypothetical protein